MARPGPALTTSERRRRAVLPGRGAAVAGIVVAALLTLVPTVITVALLLPPAGGPPPPAGPPARPAPAVPVTPIGAPDTGSPAPAALRLPGVDAAVPVVPVGVTPNGEMAVPEDVGVIGWYRFGPAPGAGRGSAVLAGHVDDRVQGAGALEQLAGVAPGTRLVVERERAGAVGYRVVDVRRVTKDALDLGALFSERGPPRLAVVTCGGPFDAVSGRYRDNVVLVAVPEVEGQP